MMVRRISWFALGTLVACASQGGSAGDTHESLNDRATEGVGGAAEGAALDAGPEGRLTPSNLPPDICDSAGATDLNVPAGEGLDLRPSDPCDALVPQSDGLPSICVRKFANVTIAGNLGATTTNTRTLAIVATGTFTIANGGLVGTGHDSGGDPRGMGGAVPSAPGGGYGGAGHVGAGAVGGKSGSLGGNAFGPTTGTQLAVGSNGAGGGTRWDGYGGSPGGAIQLVACHDLALSGTVSARGGSGSAGSDGYTPHASIPGGGGGGGSGGTIVIDAQRITSCGGRLLAVGGAGGRGGHAPEESGVGGAGGAGGTGSEPPQPGAAPTGAYVAGGGGATGRIVLNVPQGVSVPAIAADPPAAIGVLGTH